MKVFRGKNVLTHNLLTYPVSSSLTAFLNPDCQAQLMPLSLNNNCPSTVPFQSLIQLISTSIEQNVSVQENSNFGISKNGCAFQQQAHGMISRGNITNYVPSFSISSKLQLFSRNYFKALIALRAILSGQL